LCLVSINHQGNAEPKRTSCGGARIATIEKTPLRARHQLCIHHVHSEQMSRARKCLQIVGLEWSLAIRRRKPGKP
jgi:hypothetical protein